MSDIKAIEHVLHCLITDDQECSECCYFEDIGNGLCDCHARECVEEIITLLKEQEPRVMTLKEVETSKGFVWVEFNAINENRLSLEYVNVRATERLRDSFILTTDSGIKWLRDRGDYNRGIWFGINCGWRCWTSRPSPEQMRETKWEGEDDGVD